MTLLRRLALLAILLATTAMSACGGGDESAVPDGAPKEASSFSDQWPTPNGDLGNRRVATSEIHSGNVKDLGVAWTVPIKGGGHLRQLRVDADRRRTASSTRRTSPPT